MKKITIFSLHLGYGGIENAICSLANNICSDYEIEIVSTYKLYQKEVYDLDKRIKVTYLIDDDIAIRVDKYKKLIKSFKVFKLIKDLFKDYGFNIFRLIKDTINSIRILIKKRKVMINYIKNNDTDIAISTRLEYNNYLSKYAKNKIYKIAWEHNHHHSNIEYAKKLVRSCRNVDTLVLVSNSLRNYYKKLMRDYNYKCKCVFIPNMLDNIPSNTSKLDGNRIISVGRFSKEKGFISLVEVFKKYKDKNPNSNLKLDLVGDGSERNKIVDLIYKYNLTNDIKVHGYLKKPELNELLKNASLYLMTSYTESFGIVLIEAMSYGIPCIAYTSAEGANDLIINDNNGYLIENRDASKMVEKVEFLLNDKKKRIELGNNARCFSLNYSSDNIKKEWLELLKKRV